MSNYFNEAMQQPSGRVDLANSDARLFPSLQVETNGPLFMGNGRESIIQYSNQVTHTADNTLYRGSTLIGLDTEAPFLHIIHHTDAGVIYDWMSNPSIANTGTHLYMHDNTQSLNDWGRLVYDSNVFTVKASDGNAIDGTTTTEAGRALHLLAGAGGSNTTGGAGGALVLTAGNAGGTGDNEGGAVTISAGNATGDTDGSDFTLKTSAGSGTGVDGEFKVGKDGTNQDGGIFSATLRVDGTAGSGQESQNQIMFIANRAMRFKRAIVRMIAENQGGATNLNVEKVPAGTALGSGTDISAAQDLNGLAANSNTNIGGAGAPGTGDIAAGEAVAIELDAALNASTVFYVTVHFNLL